MKKYEIIKKNIEFNDIINKGSLLKNNCYNIYYKDSNLNYPRFGLAISKKIGNAVERNKIKRQLRNLIDINKDKFKNKDYIIMIRKEYFELSFTKKEDKLLEVLRKDKS